MELHGLPWVELEGAIGNHCGDEGKHLLMPSTPTAPPATGITKGKLFGPSGRQRLLDEHVLRQYLDDKRGEVIPQELDRVRVIRDWVEGLAAAGTAKETALEQSFNRRIFGDVLGYKLFPDAEATAYPKPPASMTGISSEPDVLLGRFAPGEPPEMRGVLELKKPGAGLDTPQPREGKKTPVEQAFDYGERILAVRWVLVSDMREIRLYSVDSPGEYMAFDLGHCYDASGNPTETFRRLFFIVHHDYLIAGGADSTTSSLLAKSTSKQLRIKNVFYDVYFRIRSDLVAALEEATKGRAVPLTDEELLEATQRLLDRMIFLYYCEDHPDRLIPPGTVKSITRAARARPGPSTSKVYEDLKYLFREVDAGSPAGSGLALAAYNGELFKPHPIIDEVDLPDALHDNAYEVDDGGLVRRVEGVWGLHEFDFWQELSEHLLGHIFEQSLSDIVAMTRGATVSLAEKLAERKRFGIYYTTQLLSDFLSRRAVHALLDERAPLSEVSASVEDARKELEARLDFLLTLRISDFACGSGAFAVSVYRELLLEFYRLLEGIEALASAADIATQMSLTAIVKSYDQKALLRNCIYGADLLPQAVEIAKLALWLRSARRGEKVVDLSTSIVVADSLDVSTIFKRIDAAPGTFDGVVGNPPWGGQIDPAVFGNACTALGLDAHLDWDSWEMFIVLGLHALREGGRLGLVLPDTLFHPAKERIRRILLETTTIETLHNLGPDWFGPTVRMSTIVLVARKGAAAEDSEFTAMLLGGQLRELAQRGEVPLTQLETQLSRTIPQGRSFASSRLEIEIFRSTHDDVIMATMDARGESLSVICSRHRGEEMSKAGMRWVCPSCLKTTVPGRKKKGGGYRPKDCPHCGLELDEGNVTSSHLVEPLVPGSPGTGPFIDGDDISRRYRTVTPSKQIGLDDAEWDYKPFEVYAEPKILIRQAGVGVVATYDETGARCPQSVYIYRVRPAERYSNKFVLAALLSRTMAYYIFKRFAEVDPDRAHAKLTHARLEALPIPKIDFLDDRQRILHDEIVALVDAMLAGAPLGGLEDLDIEQKLRELWGLSAEEGEYINGEFYSVPTSQVIRDLFPDGPPRPKGVVVPL